MKPIKLQKIDESLISEYSYLEPNDFCYFIGEYAGGQGFDHSEMNQVINNFKKPISRKDLPEWYFKEQAILKIAYWLVSTTSFEKLKNATWVPMPSSKIKSDSEYDDRLLRVLHRMKEIEKSLDIRELLLIKVSREAAHHPGSIRPKIKDHMENFVLDDSQKKINGKTPSAIVLLDDIITTGAHFKAAQKIIRNEFPDVPSVGLFIARSVHKNI